MQIFFLDESPEKAAQYLCNKHVVKQCLETAQILCTIINKNVKGLKAPYKSTHVNHPCVLWAGESEKNYSWLVDHGFALCKEYTYRYNKDHKCEDVIDWCFEQYFIERFSFDYKYWTQPAQAIPDQYKHANPVKAYRDYYVYDKMQKIKCVWTRRNKPGWIKEYQIPA